MLGEPDRKPFAIEAVTRSFALRGTLVPLGEVMIFVNDARRQFFAFENATVAALPADTVMKPLHGQDIMVTKDDVAFMSVLEQDRAESIRLVSTSRTVVFFTGQFVIQGKLHINPDYRDDDLLPEEWKFFPVSSAEVYPLQPLSFNFQRQVPLLILQRTLVEGYQVRPAGPEGAAGA